MLRRFSLLCLLSFCSCVLAAQTDDDDVLFTVADRPVTVGEFRYIYGKTNGEAADYSRSSVEEYLALYERFKLKVARARAMGLDTVRALQDELAGYRRQLADNYLIDRRVTDPLVEELHRRMQEDIEIHHILFTLPQDAQPADTLAVFRRATAARAGLTAENFAARARELSEDKFSREAGGRIGYVTAPFPRGLYALESALYPADAGTIVGPVRTGAGYHLAMKTASRPARGEVEIAHIFVRKDPEATPEAAATERRRIERAAADLAAGMTFEQAVGIHSDDDKTKNKGGYVGFFGINRYDPAFEEAAFALDEDGAVSDVVETRTGYHILRRVSRRGIQPLPDARPLLEGKVKAAPRFAAGKRAMLRDIRRQGGVEQDVKAFGRYAATLVDSLFFDYRWAPTNDLASAEVLLTIGDAHPLTIADLNKYLKDNARRRVTLGRSNTAYGAAKSLYEDWVDEQVLAYADRRLEEDFPEFRALMREYREGILLFEATKIEVWDKASADTTGLQQYFAAHRQDYRFPRRARLTRYTVDRATGPSVEDVLAYAREHDADPTLEHFGRRDIETATEEYDAERLAEAAEGLRMQPGSVSAITNDLRQGTATFLKVEEILPARPKELAEARGYVIADYQDQLEREWVEELRRKYPVSTNQRALAKLIQ